MKLSIVNYKKRRIPPIFIMENPFLADNLIDLTVDEDNFIRRPASFPLKSLLLTYSNPAQQGLEELASIKVELGDHLRDLEPGPIEVMVAEEHHEDGSLHYHAFVEWAPNERKVDQHFFDFKGVHPNIQVVKKKFAVANYIQKEDREPYHFVWIIDDYIDLTETS